MKVMEEQNNTWYSIIWPEEIDETALNRAYNEDDGPEDGAVAIALLLIRERTDYTAIRRSVTGTGIDYWLGYQEVENDQFFGWKGARLEVSGILRQTPSNRLKYRIARKLEQTKQSNYTSFPVYIVLVEFGQPLAEVVLSNVEP